MATLTQLRDLVREALLEKGTDKGLIPSDVVLDKWINGANASVWSKGLQQNPAPWAERSASLAMTPTGAFALGALVAPAIADNLIHSVHAVQAQIGGLWAPVYPMPGLNDHYEWDDPDPIVGAVADFRFYVEGLNLRFSPAPAANVTFRTKFTRRPSDMAAADVALGGRFPEYHWLIALVAAQMFYNRDEVRKTPWDEKILDELKSFYLTLRRTQGGITRRINRRRAY